MDKPKGGRGHTAPYETKQMRVPVGLEPQIQELIARFREWINEMGNKDVATNNPPRLLDKAVDNFRDKLANCLSHNKVLAEENEALNQRLSEALVAADRFALEYAELRSRLLEEQERPNS